MKSWLEYNGIEMYPAHIEEKSVIAERLLEHQKDHSNSMFVVQSYFFLISYLAVAKSFSILILVQHLKILFY